MGHREYNSKLVYKIRWVGYEAKHDTWESSESLSCPDLLERYNIKVNLESLFFEETKFRFSRQHKVAIPSRNKKRKAGRPKQTKKKTSPKKRRNSVSDAVSDTEDDDDAQNNEPWDGDGESDDEYEVEKILDMRTKKNGTREFLVSWKKWTSEHDTWEPEANLKCQEIIDRFLNNAEVNDEEKETNIKPTRVGRKQAERSTLGSRSARRLSKRSNKQNVSYIDGEDDEIEGSEGEGVIEESEANDVKVGDDE